MIVPEDVGPASLFGGTSSDSSEEKDFVNSGIGSISND